MWYKWTHKENTENINERKKYIKKTNNKSENEKIEKWWATDLRWPKLARKRTRTNLFSKKKQQQNKNLTRYNDLRFTFLEN